MIPSSNKRSPRILLLSAYDAASHRQWRMQLTQALTGFSWHQLTLPPRHYSWRLRGNSLSWGFGARELLEQPHDLLLCTSMTDLSALRGFVPTLGQLPTVVYFHENQFAYPLSDRAQGRVEQQMLNIYTALCADRLIFNSHFNKDSFERGAKDLLGRMPDAMPIGLQQRLSAGQVLPVPIADGWYSAAEGAVRGSRDVFTLVWNHRWEYDKGPERLLALTERLVAHRLRFRLHVLGQQFRHQPPAFAALQQLLEAHYQQHALEPGQFGYVADESQYRALLCNSDVVLSTADHDFQGLSLLEAIACGCTPLAPDHQVYPEYLPAQHRYAPTGSGIQCAAERLQHWASIKARGVELPRVDVSRFRTSVLRKSYLELLSGCLIR